MVDGASARKQQMVRTRSDLLLQWEYLYATRDQESEAEQMVPLLLQGGMAGMPKAQ